MKNICLITFVLIFYSCSSFSDKEISQGIHYFPEGLDPGVNYTSYEFQIYSQIYEPLLTLSEDYITILPCLARSWQISEDRLEYVFNLIPDVIFHDGSILTAEDIRYSFNRQIQLRLGHPIYSLIDKISVIDSLSVKINLKHPYSPFLYALASPNGLMVMSKRALQKYGRDIGKNPVGTGPFYLDEWHDNGYIVLLAFNKYREIPTIEKIKFIVPGETHEAETKFRDGELDILYMVAGYWLDRLKWLGEVTYYVQKPMNTLYIGFNLRNSPVNDLLVRRAILKSFELKKNILITNRGNAIAAQGPLPPVYKGFEDLKQDEYDNFTAKRLLDQAGYKNDLNLNLYVPEYTLSRKTKIEIIKNQLADSGIKIKVRYFATQDLYYSGIKDKNCHLFLDGYGSELIGDPGYFLYTLFHSSSSYNHMNFINKEVDLLLEKAFMEWDNEKRLNLYRNVVINVLDAIPAVFSAHVKPHFVYNSRRIKSIKANPYEFIYYHRLEMHN